MNKLEQLERIASTMKLKAIQHESGYIFVDERADGIAGWSYNKPTFNDDGKIGKSENNQSRKIIAQYNLNLGGIPHVDLEEDVQQLANNAWDENHPTERRAFMQGHKAQSLSDKKYSERDIVNAIDALLNAKSIGYALTKTDIIQSLSQPKVESIEIETKTIFDGDDEHDEGGTLPSAVESFEQSITYQKDGKTYLKVKKINYMK